MCLYSQYKAESLSEEHENVLSYTSFSRVFGEMNLSLFCPHKDQCDTYSAYKTNNLSEEEYHLHIKKKNDLARKAMENDKEEMKWVFIMDLQAVLLSPRK